MARPGGRGLCARASGQVACGCGRWAGSAGGGFDLGDEAVAGGGDGFDEAGLAAVVVEGFAEEADGAGEGVLGDGGVGPDGVEQLLLADEAAAVLDEVEEQAEGFGLEGDGRPSAMRRKAVSSAWKRSKRKITAGSFALL